MKQLVWTIVNLRGTFRPIVERTGRDKTTFVQVKADYLVTLSKYIGYEKIELS